MPARDREAQDGIGDGATGLTVNQKGGVLMTANIECLAEKARREGRTVSEAEGRKRVRAALRRIAKKRAEAIRARHAR